MTDQDYTTTIAVARAAEDVFADISDVGAWWGVIEGRADAVGAEFVYEVPDIHYSKFRVTELVAGERIVWRVLDSRLTFVADEREWDGTEIHFDLAARSDGTDVTFTHVGLNPGGECYDVCSTAWQHFIERSLRTLLVTGTGMPGTNPDGEPEAHEEWLERFRAG
ncbi:SRPBCC domain-containing protein [Occultella aeris]|uniref:Activator of Hsp90 ATPase homologue 1/2-like C-terminal domain-containing protein n=1 Tax=Occultella aeris TaxID=2761496 RepID=A0A7M4DFG5_9MICO|nr:SRPBCC domain-containing protein [Occultella aeris]VZO35658.1 hypothetical protein HALOF300_00856 [Occultella aeris]